MDYHTNAQTSTPASGSPWLMAVTNQPALSGLTTIQAGPQSTQSATTIASGTSYTLGTSIGFNEAQGFNVSVTASTTVSNTQTTTVPPVNVVDAANLVNGQTEWGYTPTQAQPGNTTISFYNQWIWAVPFSAYASGQDTFSFNVDAVNNPGYNANAEVQAVYTASVPLPFGTTFAVQNPVVTGVSAHERPARPDVHDPGDGLLPVAGDRRPRRRPAVDAGAIHGGQRHPDHGGRAEPAGPEPAGGRANLPGLLELEPRDHDHLKIPPRRRGARQEGRLRRGRA